jgi:DNA-binding response OmpR family regulator
MTRILIVEHDQDIGGSIRRELEYEGHQVESAAQGANALRRAQLLQPEVIVLVAALPAVEAYAALRQLRDLEPDASILVVANAGDKGDMLRCLRLGADDVARVPLAPVELLVRLDVLLRRAVRSSAHAESSTPALQSAVHFGSVEVDPLTHGVTRAGKAVELRPREFELLIALIRRAGGIATRFDLMREVWGDGQRSRSRTIDTHIVELRRKLEDDPCNPRHILTIGKSGYRLLLDENE